MPAPTQVDQVVRVTNKTSFVSTNQHRPRPANHNKSAWSITLKEEYISFLKSKMYVKANGKVRWGVHIKNSTLDIIGYSARSNDLKFAKFTSHENNNDLWHGYPAEPGKKTGDRPEDSFIKHLVTKGYISKAKFSKIKKGETI